MGEKTLIWLKIERDKARYALTIARHENGEYERLRRRYTRLLNCIDKMIVRAVQGRWHPEGR